MGGWWDVLSVIVAVLPGAFAWWSGRRLLRFIDDPALGERALARAGQVTQAATVALVLLILLPGPLAKPLLAVLILGVALGGFGARRRLLGETWSFTQYLVFIVRFLAGWAGFWLLLAASSSIVFAAGQYRVVAPALAGVLLIWHARQHALFLMMLGARRVELPDHLRTIQQRSRVRDVWFYRIPVRGGRLATAFAVPSRRKPAVAFSDTVLEMLTEDEQAAVYGHELAHLEHIAATRRPVLEWGLIGLLVAAGTLGPLAPGVAAWMGLLWGLVVFVLFGQMLAQNRKREEASDRRAVELCGDAGALERALIKLTVLARLPRRWSQDFERGATHPSLARRIQAIRALGAQGPATDAVASSGDGTVRVVSGTGHPIVLGPDHLEWAEGGIPRRAAYRDLTDLRIHAGLSAGAALQVVEVSGRSWRILLDARTVPEIQAALDRVDTRLGSLPPTPRAQRMLGRVLGVILMVLAWLVPMVIRGVAISISSLAAGISGLVVPGLTAAVAMAIASSGLVIVGISRGMHGLAIMLIAAVALVAVETTILALRERRHPQTRGARFTTVTFLAMPLAGFAAPLIGSLYSGEEGLPLMADFFRHIPDLWLLPVTLGGAVLASVRGRLRWLAAVPLLLVAVAFALAAL